PAIGDRSSPKEWEELGKPNLVEVAQKRKDEILASFNPTHIPEELDKKIRSNFNVLL
ncbi:MAG: methyltransferase, partial [Candidatus Puniceispirillum sp.]|nr:methyltransferase [Candidatus Puniceispirillum sp.]